MSRFATIVLVATLVLAVSAQIPTYCGDVDNGAALNTQQYCLDSANVCRPCTFKGLPELYMTTCKDANKVALTFDDGPFSGNTIKLMDILDAQVPPVPATFFLVGSRMDPAFDPSAASNQAIAQQIVNRPGGRFTVGSHSYAHKSYKGQSFADVQTDAKKAIDFIKQATGKIPRYVRPPQGDRDTTVYSALTGNSVCHDRIVIWNIASGDDQPGFYLTTPNDYSATAVVNASYLDARITQQLATATTNPNKASWIMLQHDLRARSVENVANEITLLKNKGYTLVSLPECFGDSSAYLDPTLACLAAPAPAPKSGAAAVTLSVFSILLSAVVAVVLL